MRDAQWKAELFPHRDCMCMCTYKCMYYGMSQSVMISKFGRNDMPLLCLICQKLTRIGRKSKGGSLSGDDQRDVRVGQYSRRKGPIQNVCVMAF